MTTPLNGASRTTAPTTASSSAATAGFDKDMFMKLLVAQLKHQDPSSPTDMNGMTAQMTQFGILEQLTNLAKSGEASSTSLARTEALALLGKTVKYRDADSNFVEGVVEHVDVSTSKPTLTVGGKTGIDPSILASVR